uniref:NAD-dependent histone deacetylase SIR2 n=1 Tax=Ganoderma boninense TaxID=34458 RepID=A0A5K1JRK3_9APHY|nr:NAD-dependent histone deacetylase SIR2 [Ganoderma boninense]
MTTFLPLDVTTSFPSSPAFLVPSPDHPVDHTKRVIKAVLKARRIIVVCGAGISVEAGIPDFRSSEGLFQSLKKDHPRLASGKALFDASIFRSVLTRSWQSQDTISLFCQMIARLSQLSEAAKPTTFHQFLRTLDDRQRLLRVYTQNIDALEEKSGLSFGFPGPDSKGGQHSSRTKKAPVHGAAATEAPPYITQPSDSSTTSRTLSPPSSPAETPKCIPLHGTLKLMHCEACTQSYPLRDHIESLVSGIAPPCPQCAALEETRLLIGKRSHTIGRLRPSVVLYNEEHKDGEVVGSVVQKDLMRCLRGKGRGRVDLLLVVGTSLHIPGTKRLVRDFSKAVRSQDVPMNAPPDAPAHDATLSTQGLLTPGLSPHRSSGRDDQPPVRAIYLNLEFPESSRDWDGVFDVWIRGDAQAFAKMFSEELEKEKLAKEVPKERKRKRETTTAEKTRRSDR